MVAAVATVDPNPNAIPTRTVVKALVLEHPSEPQPTGEVFAHEDRLQQGDTFALLLSRLGVDARDSAQLLREHGNGKTLRALRPGATVRTQTTEDGELISLRFLVGKDSLVGFDRDGNRFKPVQETANLTSRIVMRSGEIHSSLFAAADEADVPDAVASQLADIFGGDIDFHRDLRKGDRFTVVFEQLLHEGRELRAGRVLAAEFVNSKKTFRAVWFDGEDGEGNYYAPDGKSLRKAFLRSPLEFSRVTSGFAMRFHPILQTWRQHNGIDYGAPVGTKVRATANGVVDFAGVQGGYGRVVILRHGNGITTAYAHLNGFASGIQKGARVSQGDAIGYVGATGWATGPHLHYEFRVGNDHRNPLTIALPAADPVPAPLMAKFKAATAASATQLELARELTFAALE
jgi:murein DD-endopeptidase MepM/ murein hydrolase activator NlpD